MDKLIPPHKSRNCPKFYFIIKSIYKKFWLDAGLLSLNIIAGYSVRHINISISVSAMDSFVTCISPGFELVLSYQINKFYQLNCPSILFDWLSIKGSELTRISLITAIYQILTIKAESLKIDIILNDVLTHQGLWIFNLRHRLITCSLTEYMRSHFVSIF